MPIEYGAPPQPQTGTGNWVRATSPTLTAVTITPTAVATLSTSQSQASGGTTLLAFSATTGAVAGQLVSGTSITPGTQVASIVSTATITQAANGSFSSGQKVIPMATTAGFAVGQQVKDNTGAGVIGAGNVIASIQANTSITLTSNTLTNSVGAADSITADPVVTLTLPATATVGAGASIAFTANAGAFSASSAIYDAGDASIAGNANITGSIVSNQNAVNTSIPSNATAKGSNILLIGRDSTGRAITSYAFGASSNTVFGIQASGTAASPAATQADQQIWTLSGGGYGATGWITGAKAQLRMNAAENWTDSAAGTYFVFLTTAKTTTAITDRWRITDAGVLQAALGNPLAWGTTSGFSGGNPDTGLSRISAGVVGVGTGAQDSVAGTLKATLQTSTNATTGLTPGVLAASTNASIVITDGSGQVYRIPCII